jgi:two-component system LytT family sensor kinase
MKLSLKILIHTIYWIVFSVFTLLVNIGHTLGEFSHLNNLTPHFVINFFWASIIFYLFYFYFIRFFEGRQFVKYLIFSILTSIALTLLFLPVHIFFHLQFKIFSYKYLVQPMVGTFIIAQCGCLVRGFENWFTSIQLKSELESRNLRNELELLKSQINPHFLFNSLNNIDSLIRKSPETASVSLVTLSDMLRHMIYEAKTDKVLLSEEIVYLRNYISLQQLRFRDKKYVGINFPERCEGIQIAPMLLIPFIENAFKYATNIGKLPVIDISVQCNYNSLIFSCRNYYKKEKPQYEPTEGVGLKNVQRRLEILYAEKHQLDIADEGNVFKVELTIDLV